jgi:UDP-N-acetylglucosamine--N-acetylmuramyl-(pentapeptide) pyrophosphoryl-undecaprenol N-acetylglucosamine transferase
MHKKIVIAGGGTGGHIFPAIAIANALKSKQPSVDILFIGANGKMEMEKVPQAGYPIRGIDIAGFERGSLLKNLSLPYKLINSFFQVKKIITTFKPDAAIGVGGYSSFPVLRYAQAVNIPTFIHESNSFAGKSNILLGKKAVRVFVNGDGMEKFFPADKITVSGNPVRSNIVNHQITKNAALQSFGLMPDKLTILAVGGSLGARSINEVLAAHIHELDSLQLQLIWQTGRTTASTYIERGKSWSNVWVNDFITDMSAAYTAADVVISRAGAMAVTELCVAAKPVIFVPFPFAAEDHQTINARHLSDRGAAIVIKDEEAMSKLFAAAVNLVKDKDAQTMMIKNISKLAITNADDTIASEILNSIS